MKRARGLQNAATSTIAHHRLPGHHQHHRPSLAAATPPPVDHGTQRALCHRPAWHHRRRDRHHNRRPAGTQPRQVAGRPVVRLGHRGTRRDPEVETWSTRSSAGSAVSCASAEITARRFAEIRPSAAITKASDEADNDVPTTDMLLTTTPPRRRPRQLLILPLTSPSDVPPDVPAQPRTWAGRLIRPRPRGTRPGRGHDRWPTTTYLPRECPRHPAGRRRA